MNKFVMMSRSLLWHRNPKPVSSLRQGLFRFPFSRPNLLIVTSLLQIVVAISGFDEKETMTMLSRCGDCLLVFPCAAVENRLEGVRVR